MTITQRALDAFADMLGELGISLTPEELMEGAPASASAAVVPYADVTVHRHEEHKMLPSFVHMTHLVPERSYVPYKRITHFVQHLAQVTGRNWREEDWKVVDSLRREKVDVADPMAYFTVRRLLKRWGYTSPHYRRIFAMLRKMGSGSVLTLSYQQERVIRTDFLTLCRKFEHRHGHRGSGRKNFISYYLIVQLLLIKYGVESYYDLPSIKDNSKFRALIDMYKSLIAQRV